MWFSLREGLCSIVLILCLINSAFAQSKTTSSNSNSFESPAEAAVRGLAEEYFALYAGKNLEGLMNLWSTKSPGLAARRKSTADFFQNNDKIALKSFAVRDLKIAGDTARVHVEAEMQVIETKTGKEKAEYGRV